MRESHSSRKAVFSSGSGGQESHVFQLAQHIASDQRVEIARMKRMLLSIG